MSLQETLTRHMKEALKAGEKARLSTVRMLISELKNQRIALQRDLDEHEELAFLATQAKRRRESIEAYDAGGRDDLAARERDELKVIEDYLPRQLSHDEVRQIVADAITQSGASSKKEMGQVMRLVMPQVQGRFPGKDVRPIVEDALGA